MNEMLEVIRDGQMFAVKVTYDSAKAFEPCRVGNIPFALKRVGDDAASRCSIGIDGDVIAPGGRSRSHAPPRAVGGYCAARAAVRLSSAAWSSLTMKVSS